MKPKGIIFDLDGTLLDSMPVWQNVSRIYLESLKLAAPEDLWLTIKAMSNLESAQYLKDRFQLPYTASEIMQQINLLLEIEYRERIPLKPFAAQLLKSLQNKGIKICIATATDRYLVESALKHHGIMEGFSFILTCSEVGCGKDQATIFEQALELLDTRLEETLIFEDALHAVKTAKAAGFKVVGVYDRSADEDCAAIRALSDMYIITLEEWQC